jgi:Domain of unknown function (DUF5069)
MVKEPRSGSTEIAGLSWLARMIDKARLEKNGEIDQFDLEYPCPMDQGLLRQLGISAELFQQIVTSSSDDALVIEELKKAGVKLL